MVDPKFLLSKEEIDRIVEETRLASEIDDDAARAARLSGARCFCCDAPLPAGHAGPECAECASIES